MKKTIFLYGFLLAAFTGLLKFIEYRFLVRDLSIEFYIGAVAVFFTALGVWAGLKFTQRKTVAVVPVTAAPPRPPADLHSLLLQHGISKRELEVLALISQGLSNQEIADRLFVSLNTVKTHSSNLFSKLDAKRRTQAIQKAKEIGLLNG
ncbi:MAG: DNA-binding response regulator [Bacteroidetes bacterium]|nr:DNA-binding response regulator [Bacteroidota bacterium]